MKDRLLHFLQYLLLSACLFHAGISAFSQQQVIPLNRDFQQEIDRTILLDSLHLIHSGSRPMLYRSIDLSETYYFKKDSMKVYNWAMGRMFKHHFFEITKDDFFLAIDPLFDFSYGEDFTDTTNYIKQSLYFNQRGAQFIGDIGKKFSFQTSFYETQTVAPLYLKDIADSTQVYPGFGRTKSINNIGFDFAMANGWISYSPITALNLQFGNGKQFIGHGYRSLLLSDAAFSYPYLKASTRLFDGHVEYTTTYASLQTLERLPLGEVPEALFKRKAASFHYLSVIPMRGIEIGLFESIIWPRYDSSGTISQSWGAYLPVIGVQTALNGFQKKNHVSVGANLKVAIGRHAMIYGQVLTDDPGAGRIGWQAGGKLFDLLLPKLDLQVEWNQLPEFAYTSPVPLQSYSHFNQPLGHPTGPGTQEILMILNFRHKRFFWQFKANSIEHTLRPGGSWASNPDLVIVPVAAWPDHSTRQGDFLFGFQMNPKTNARLSAGVTYRKDRTDLPGDLDFERQTTFCYLQFRTNLINRYADF